MKEGLWSWWHTRCLEDCKGNPISCYIHVDIAPAMVHSQLWPAFTNLWQSMQPFAESHTPLPTCVNPCWIFTRLCTAHTTISHLPIYIYHMWQCLWLGTIQSWLLLRLLEILFPSWASGSFLRAVNCTLYELYIQYCHMGAVYCTSGHLETWLP